MMTENKETKNFRERDLVFVDIETTGLSVAKHEIIEIAAVVVDGKDFSFRKSFSEKTKPLHPETADPGALKINGYTKEGWKEAKSLEEVLKKLAVLSPGGMIAGWNVAFDWMFLKRDLSKYKIKHLYDYHVIDIMSVAYALLFPKKETTSLSLRQVGKQFDLKLSEKHNALEDAMTTYKIFEKLMSDYLKKK